jgi:hypothetical protein
MKKVSVTLSLPPAVIDGIAEFRKDFDGSLPPGCPKPSRNVIISILLHRALTVEGITLADAGNGQTWFSTKAKKFGPKA